MKNIRQSAVTVVIAAGVLVGAANVATYAANGHAFLLGSHNSETKASVLTRTSGGPALQLQTKKSSPPLAVNSSKKVARLNADQVDGFSAADFGQKIITSHCSVSAPAGTDTAVCATTPYHSKSKGLAIVSFSLDGFSSTAGYLAGQPYVQVDGGAWSELTPSWYTQDGMDGATYASVSNSGYVQLAGGHSYKFAIDVLASKAVSSGDGKVLVQILPANPGNKATNTKHEAAHGSSHVNRR